MLQVDLPPDVDEAKARLLLALALFQEDLLSTRKAAKMAGLSYRAFVDELSERGIPWITYTEEMHEEDIAFARSFEPPEAP